MKNCFYNVLVFLLEKYIKLFGNLVNIYAIVLNIAFKIYVSVNLYVNLNRIYLPSTVKLLKNYDNFILTYIGFLQPHASLF